MLQRGCALFQFGIAAALFSVLSAGAFAQSEAQSVNDAYFGVSKYTRKSLQITPDHQEELEAIRRQVVRELSLSGSMLKAILRAELGTSKLSDQPLEAILAPLTRAPLFVCEGPDQCLCPSESTAACSQAREYGEGISLLLLVDPCLLSRNLGLDCAKSRALSGKKTQKGDTFALRTAIAHGIYRLAEVRLPLQKVASLVNRLRVLMADLSEVEKKFRASCGGRYPWAPSQLLLKSGHIAEIENPYVRECGRNLLAPLFSDSKKWGSLPAACRTILDQKRFEAWGALKNPTIVRCDSIGAELTCRERSPSPENARALWFGKQAVLDVPQEACEGPRPKDPADFWISNLFPYLVKGAYASSLKGETVAQCLTALQLSPARNAKEKSSHSEEWSAPLLDLEAQ